MVPEPLRPTSGGSSPKWGPELEMDGRRPVLQNPRSSLIRFIPHFRGQTLQEDNRSKARSIRSASSPLMFRVTYPAGFFSGILIDP
jgi:hypothetical protein